MSDYSCIPPEIVKKVQEDRFEGWKERAIGIMLGMAVGDALGAQYDFLIFNAEGYREEDRLNRYKLLPGQWTDDTSMGLCLADMLLVDRTLNETQLMWAYYDWAHYGYNSAFTQGAYRSSIGLAGNVEQSLAAFPDISREDRDVSRPTQAGTCFTSGNGSLMCNGPVAIAARSLDEARELAARQSKTTHQGDEAAACCELMAYILFLALHAENENPADIKDLIFDCLEEFECSQPSVNELAKGMEAENPATHEIENWNWLDPEFSFHAGRLELMPGYIGSYAMDALAMALHCVFTTESFEEAVIKAATRGGDADTVGAITGQIAGAIYGREAIPKKWVDDIQVWDRGGEIAARGYLLTL